MSGQWYHPLAGGGFGKPVGVAVGFDEVGVVGQPVDGGGGQRGRQQLVEP